MANLWLHCKACGKQFFSGVDAPPPETRTHECMFCHAAPEYDLQDYTAGYTDADLDAAAAAAIEAHAH